MIKKLCVLIPSFNEGKTIGAIVKSLKVRNIVTYVVDDGSTDDTANIAAEEGAIVVKHKVNKGKGASLREGFKHILKKEYDAVIVMDADGQHMVEDIDSFLKRDGETGADMIIGNRMSDISGMPMVRVHTNRFMSWLVSLIAKQRIPDSQSGYRLFKSNLLTKILPELVSSNYEIESEMIIRASRAGFRIDAAPIKTVYQDEKSRINPVTDTLRFILFLVRISIVK